MTAIEKIILAALISSASVMASFISPELTLIKNYYSLASNQLSQIMTLYLAGYLSGQIIWAYISNKIGRLASIKFGMATSILGALVIIAAIETESFPLFLAARLLIAFGFTLIKENLSPQESKRYLSIIAVVFTASIYLSILLSGYLVKYTSLVFIMWAMLSYNMIMFFLCFYIKNQPSRANVSKKLPHLISVELQPNVIAFSLVLSITTIISYCYALYAPIITQQMFSLSPTEFGLCSLINMFFIFLGGILYLKLDRELSAEATSSLGLLIIITGCSSLLLMAAFNLQPTVFEFFALCALLNLANGLIYPAATYKALEYGRCKSTSSAIMNLIKLTMPMVAIYASTYVTAKELIIFISTILLFALLYLFILQLIKNSLPKLHSNKVAQ